MHRHLGLAAVAIAAMLNLRPTFAFTPQTDAGTSAISWLHGQQKADGSVAGDSTRTEETVWGLVAHGQSLTSFESGGQSLLDFLRTSITAEEKSAGNIGNLVLAVSAAGLDPAHFAGRNLLQDLQCTYDPQIGRYNAQLFNDAIAILALPPDGAPQKATAYLAAQQQTDGGWEFQPGFGTDTNTTAIAVMALQSAHALSSSTKDRALAYFRLHQKPSGGFEYSAPFAPPGDSDPNSDALVIEALLAAGQDPTGNAWTTADKKDALQDLLTFQYSNGGFGFSRPGSSPTAVPDVASTTQALVALASRTLPLKPTQGIVPATCPATSASGTPASASSTTPRLAQTGAAPLPPLAAGAVLVLIGWRLRRRTAR